MPNLLDRHLSEKGTKKFGATKATQATNYHNIMKLCVKNGILKVARGYPQAASMGHSSDLVAPVAFFPNSCPIITGRATPGVMRACRFSEECLWRFIKEGVLTPDQSCPLKKACGLCSPIGDNKTNTQLMVELAFESL